jgi:hypothetical protein
MTKKIPMVNQSHTICTPCLKVHHTDVHAELDKSGNLCHDMDN